MRAEEVKILEKGTEKLQTRVDELNSKISDFKEYEDEIEEFSNVFYEEDEYQFLCLIGVTYIYASILELVC